jgi:cob(I)alamin adenosyltransferase
MVRITKVHTGVGDGGMTRHLDGTEVAKSDARLELVGTIDELNCVVGVVRMELDRFSDVAADGGHRATVARVRRTLLPRLARLQQELFDLGAECSAHPERIPEGMCVLPESAAEELLTEMDEWLEEVEPLSSFILPTGSPPVAQLHMARVVTRRMERCLAALVDAEGDDSVRPFALAYVNRLSDWFFVLARWVCVIIGEAETLWEPIGRREPE